MQRDPAFQQPFATLPARDLLALGRMAGRRSLRAKWSFLALLPEILRKEAYLKAGYTSVFEYAAHVGGATRREVLEVLNLADQIGQYWVLWRLLAMGAAGMSKLQLIRRWVTAENAAWWAEQVEKCTSAQLKALIASLSGNKEGPSAPEAPADLPSVEQPLHQNPKQEAHGETPPRAALQESLPSMGLGLEFPSESTAADTQVGNSLVFYRLVLSPYGAKALRDLHALAEQADGPIAVGELIEALLIDALHEGWHPGRNSAASAEPAAPSATESPEPPQPPPHSRKKLLEVVYRNLDTGARWLPSRDGPIAVETLPAAEQARVESAAPIYFAELRARALAAKVRHARRIDAKRTAGELLDTDDGRHIPAAIEVYLMARSGGLCERRDCGAPVERLHHVVPYSECRAHDPDKMLAICSRCHDIYHSGLMVPDKADPRVLCPVEPGTPIERTQVDTAYLAAKAKHMEAG